TASLSASGLVPMSAAIAGNEVAITVESMFSMNRATATISGTMRLASMRARAATSMDARGETGTSTRGVGWQERLVGQAEHSLRHVNRISAASEGTHCAAASAAPHRKGARLKRLADGLFARSLASAARSPAERPTVCGHLQSHPHRALRPARAYFSHRLPHSVTACRHCGPHKARGPQAPRTGKRDRAVRATAGLRALTPQQGSDRGKVPFLSR